MSGVDDTSRYVTSFEMAFELSVLFEMILNGWYLLVWANNSPDTCLQQQKIERNRKTKQKQNSKNKTTKFLCLKHHVHELEILRLTLMICCVKDNKLNGLNAYALCCLSCFTS